MNKIMFNDKYGLTEAVLQGRKTMTRRMIADKDEIDAMVYSRGSVKKKMEYLLSKSRYKIDEVVAVAQAYRDCNNNQEMRFDDVFGTKGWNNKMFVLADLMPHQIRITNIKVERLQDISDEDALKEGIYGEEVLDAKLNLCYTYTFYPALRHYETAREAFSHLIDKVSGKGTWDSNPYVFAYSFELVK